MHPSIRVGKEHVGKGLLHKGFSCAHHSCQLVHRHGGLLCAHSLYLLVHWHLARGFLMLTQSIPISALARVFLMHA